MTFNINRSIDPWLDRTITDDKNACRKVQRMLERENDLDSEVKYGTEQFVDAQPEVMEARVGEGHYSKRNVDRRAKRQKAKTIKLQQRLKQATRRVKNTKDKLSQTQAALEEANSACHDLRLQVKQLVKEAKESQIVNECNQQDIEEYIQELETKVRELELHSHTVHTPFLTETRTTGRGHQYSPIVHQLYYALLVERIPPKKIKGIV